ncbi:GNAT family N-acetyltransferase [Isoptericola sp. NEAU-Y5]|uniref:GNAT family N-acetyltransferase n=1 Tax=Isoptericola luteus TaxID=2879484 RepID=A0ABS7ZFQ8_9MICO|nr:GNAT family N-acetyltransferase [Isoptericola sp. NEAU-Y5]MCA5893322.1 GNAT family N-acetyltransferase [Isoptericola sp. NEAU-Y5]
MTSSASRSALPAGYAFRPLTADDRHALLDLDTWAFPAPYSIADFDELALPLTWERTVGVEGPAGDGLVALRASYPFTRFPVPGGELPTAGLTWVGVHPQHRRRGLLSAMIDDHLGRCRERGEALSALFAAEAAIYGRFGYGKAADDVRLTIPRGAALRDVPGADEHTVRIEHADRERHGELVARLHRAPGIPAAQGALNRPGWATRESEELWASYWSDPKTFRSGGRESLRVVVVERDGEPRGYATFRRTLGWEVTGPRGTVHAGDVVALDAAAARALWGVLLDLDLMSTTEPFLLPADDPVLSLLVDPRAAGARVTDNVWVRLVDVPTALAGRRYQGDVDVVVGVTDTRLPDNAGSWHLRADAFGTATCERTQAAPDLELDVRELGAAYLGGTSLAALAGAGLVAERSPGALATASAAFGWPVAPACGWVF